jgi:hypothetical protein
MEGWSKLQSSLGNINFAQAGNKLTKGFNSSVQATRERLGHVAQDEITELPQGLSSLSVAVSSAKVSSRIQGPRSSCGCTPYCPPLITKVSILISASQCHALTFYPRITKVYESESYDYPTQIQESISELSSSIGYNISSFAANNLKGTNLPVPQSPTTPKPATHKTLPHALVRSSTTASNALQATVAGREDRLGKALALYATGWDKISVARLEQDATIQENFLHPWQTTLSTSIAVAMKARQAVKGSRLELDAAKQG